MNRQRQFIEYSVSVHLESLSWSVFYLIFFLLFKQVFNYFFSPGDKSLSACCAAELHFIINNREEKAHNVQATKWKLDHIQAGGCGGWWGWQECSHHPVLPKAVCHRLWPHHWGQLHSAHRGGWAVVHIGW